MSNEPIISEEEINKSEPISYQDFEAKVKYIQGKVLTVVEASIANEMQSKAIKDLIKHIFSEELTKAYNWTHPNVQLLTESDSVGAEK